MATQPEKNMVASREDVLEALDEASRTLDQMDDLLKRLESGSDEHEKVRKQYKELNDIESEVNLETRHPRFFHSPASTEKLSDLKDKIRNGKNVLDVYDRKPKPQ